MPPSCKTSFRCGARNDESMTNFTSSWWSILTLQQCIECLVHFRTTLLSELHSTVRLIRDMPLKIIAMFGCQITCHKTNSTSESYLLNKNKAHGLIVDEIWNFSSHCQAIRNPITRMGRRSFFFPHTASFSRIQWATLELAPFRPLRDRATLCDHHLVRPH